MKEINEEEQQIEAMVVPTQGPAYILLKDTVGLKRPPRRAGLRFGTQKLFTASAGSLYLANKDEKQPQDKTMISMMSLTDSKRILVTPKEQTRLLSTAELNMLLPIASDENRVNILTGTVFYEAVTSQIDDIVTVHDGEVQADAKVKYVGKLPWKQYGVYLGVEFEEAIGDNNGRDLFDSKDKHAKFITADKIVKFVFKQERTHYAVSKPVIKTPSSKASNIYKRFSIPLAFNFVKGASKAPKMKTSISLEDITQEPVVDEPDKPVEREEEIHYAVSNILQENNNVENKPKAEKKMQKRRSFPLSFTLPKIMKSPVKVRSKSLDDIPQNDTENPYYAQSSEMTTCLDKIPEHAGPPVLCFNDGCDVTLDKEKMTEHEENDCKFALEKCPNEGCDLEIARKDINKHDIVECEYAFVNCPNKGCLIKVLRKLISQHLLNCTHQKKDTAILACVPPLETYEDMGLVQNSKELKLCPVPKCSFRGPGTEVCQHLCQEHCDLMIQHFSDLQKLFAVVNLDELYSKPIKNKEQENPLYSTPFNSELDKHDDENIYLSPCDSFKIDKNDTNDEHIYLKPCDESLNSNNGGVKKLRTPSSGEYEELSQEFQI